MSLIPSIACLMALSSTSVEPRSAPQAKTAQIADSTNKAVPPVVAPEAFRKGGTMKLRTIRFEYANPNPDPEDQVFDIVGTGGFPVSVNVSDNFTITGDPTKGNKAVDRFFQLHVLVGFSGVTYPTKDQIVYKWSSDIVITPAGESRTVPIKTDISLPAGDYAFQVFVCNPQDSSWTPLTGISWLGEGDPFISGCIYSGKAGYVKVLPPAANAAKAKSKVTAKAKVKK